MRFLKESITLGECKREKRSFDLIEKFDLIKNEKVSNIVLSNY